MADVFIGRGNLEGKGVYAARDFKRGEIVIKYNLKSITEIEYRELSEAEKIFTHIHYGILYLYSEPERYVNHSNNPNTYQDLENKCDVAIHHIQKGKEITTDAVKDDI